MKRILFFIFFAIIISCSEDDPEQLDIYFFGKATVPQLKTSDITKIGSDSAICGGSITFTGNTKVNTRGVCYSINQNPTLLDPHTVVNEENDYFESIVKGLTPSTKYFVRAYATNDYGTSYGNEIFFITQGTVPIVETDSINNIDMNFASCYGNVISDGGAEILSRGICFSTNPNPTLEDSMNNSGSGTGSYKCKLLNLNGSTTYYIKAYATNKYGTSYGKEISFTTTDTKKVGSAMFWFSQYTYTASVYLEGEYVGSINMYYTGGTPDCGDIGCVTVNDLPPGTYHYTASNSIYNWEGTVIVTANECYKMRLCAGACK